MTINTLNQLLITYHTHSLNLFIKNFLKIIQKLLKYKKTKLQILTTQSINKIKKNNIL